MSTLLVAVNIWKQLSDFVGSTLNDSLQANVSAVKAIGSSSMSSDVAVVSFYRAQILLVRQHR